VTTNLAVPGCGSLFAGYRVGYAQFAIYAIGFGLTCLFGLRTLYWFVTSANQNQQAEFDPSAYLADIWQHLRWPLLGVALFLVALLWAMITSATIMAESRAFEAMNKVPRPIPPKL
jgi:hypothetical protein